jgi:hypothetical protein
MPEESRDPRHDFLLLRKEEDDVMLITFKKVPYSYFGARIDSVKKSVEYELFILG